MVLGTNKKIKRSYPTSDFMFPSAHFLQEQKLATLKQLLLRRKFRRETLKILR